MSKDPTMLLNTRPLFNFDGVLTDANQTIERIQAMKQKENYYSCCTDYFSGTNGSRSVTLSTIEESQQDPDVLCRSKMCQWCYTVVEYYNFNRETAEISMSCFDRFLATSQGRDYLLDQYDFQLASITCLYIAIKVHEPMELGMKTICELSRGKYVVAQISRMEKEILISLQWKVNPPTIESFVQHYLMLLPSSLPAPVRGLLLDATQYLSELSTVDYDLFISYKPSVIGLAVVEYALKKIDNAQFSSSLKNKFIKNLRVVSGFSPSLEYILHESVFCPVVMKNTRKTTRSFTETLKSGCISESICMLTEYCQYALTT